MSEDKEKRWESKPMYVEVEKAAKEKPKKTVNL